MGGGLVNPDEEVPPQEVPAVYVHAQPAAAGAGVGAVDEASESGDQDHAVD
jgi:hypothetical protein